nr:hypothetical protein [Endobacterium cereale]
MRYLVTDFLTTMQGLMIFGAVIGAGGYALGTSGSIGRAVQTFFRPGKKRRDARSLAMLSVLALDDYVGSCYAAVHDVPEFNPADQVEFAFHIPEPVLSLPKDVDWQLLGEDLGDEMLWFANRVINLENALESLDLSKNDHDGFFERRIEGYARLAARAMDLIEKLSIEFNLTLPEKPDYYRQAEGLSKVLRNVEAVARRRGAGSVPSDETNITPLFPKTS